MACLGCNAKETETLVNHVITGCSMLVYAQICRYPAVSVCRVLTMDPGHISQQLLPVNGTGGLTTFPPFIEAGTASINGGNVVSPPVPLTGRSC